MPPPDREQVTVATSVLRAEANEWDRQSAAIADVERKVRDVALGRIEAGLFQMVVSAYNEVVTAVTDRCAEGKVAMTEMGATLRKVADTYDSEDRANEHSLRNLY